MEGLEGASSRISIETMENVRDLDKEDIWHLNAVECLELSNIRS